MPKHSRDVGHMRDPKTLSSRRGSDDGLGVSGCASRVADVIDEPVTGVHRRYDRRDFRRDDQRGRSDGLRSVFLLSYPRAYALEPIAEHPGR